MNPIAHVAGEAAEPASLALMLAVFALLLARVRWPIGVALAVAAWAGAAANGEWVPLRHLVEGASSYLDALMVIATAMLFMRALADAGALGALATAVERRFGRAPSVLLPVVMLIVMFPGMMTGSSTASVLTTGSMAATVLGGLGLARERAAAFVAMGGVLGMIAPPVNIPAMIIGAGIDLPYVGFAAPLALGAFPLALLLSYTLGWPVLRAPGARVGEPQRRYAAPPGAGGDLPLWRALVPIVAVAALMVGAGGVAGARARPGLPLVVRHRPARRVDGQAPARDWRLARARDRGSAAGAGHPGGRRRVHPGNDAHGCAWLVGGPDAVGADVGRVRGGGRQHAAVRGGVGLRIGVGPGRAVPARVDRPQRGGDHRRAVDAGGRGRPDAAGVARRHAGHAGWRGSSDRQPVLRLCIVPALLVVAVGALLLVGAPVIGRWIG